MSDLPPNSMRELTIEPYYRSGENDVVRQFFIPLVSAASSYSRAVGYFSAASMTLLATGLQQFEERGAHMRIVASPHLQEGDIEAIDNGYNVRSVLERALTRTIDLEDHDALLDGLGVVGRMIAKGLLDIKLAFIEDSRGFGLYHEKMGYFDDHAGDLVAFTGSANETYGGFVSNFESIEVYRSWVAEDSSRALRIKQSFDQLWEGETPRLSIIDFPDAARERLVRLAQERTVDHIPVEPASEVSVSEPSRSLGRLQLPTDFEPRDYQKEAVDLYLRNGGRGVLKMATGTGKTKTALLAATTIAAALAQREQPLIVVVAAPYQHLVDQWIDEISDFGVDAVGIYESSLKWQPRVHQQVIALNLGQRPTAVFVATNASLNSDHFQQVLRDFSGTVMFIGDEVHNFGSTTRLSSLPGSATFRLGLSATPERWLDEDGTTAIFDYFGPVVFELDLGQAIEMGALCRYTYLPRIVELSREETELYVEVTRQLAPLLQNRDSTLPDDDSVLGQLLRKRSGVLGHAKNKLRLLAGDMNLRRDRWFQLVYCAEGRRPLDEGYADEPTQLAQVLQLVGNALGLSTQKYVAETSRAERRRLLGRFGSGDDLRILTSMRCLDEGVDIPDARVAYFLASSSNPRQFVQRRGRILRPAPGKVTAEIIDYVVVPSEKAPVNFDVERKLLARELARINEFGRISENYGATLDTLRPFKQRYQLMDM